MTIVISGDIKQQILRQMEQAYPAEGCGLLIGQWQDDKAIANTYFEINNQVHENQARRFLIPAKAYLETEDKADELGLSIISIVHSHPDHTDRPSEFDREHAWPGFSYLIVSVRQGQVHSYHSWLLKSDRSAFEPESIIEDL